MKITFIGHASLLIEAGDVTILSDPWWSGSCFGVQWWTYPQPRSDILQGRRFDYIYISHGHHDHLHPATLRTIDRDAKVILSKNIGLSAYVKKLGFEVIEVKDDEVLSLSSTVSCRVMETQNPDTLMAVTDGREVCVNLNDALHAAAPGVQSDSIERLSSLGTADQDLYDLGAWTV